MMTMLGKKGAPQDHFGLKGRVEIWAYRGNELFDYQDLQNIVLYQGNAEIIQALSSIPQKQRIINRMCIGDLGTIPADTTSPKIPTKDMTALYHEVYRKDCDEREVTLMQPDPTDPDGIRMLNQCKFIATFAATDIAISAYANPSQPRVNEVGLIIIDPTTSGIERTAVTAPNAPLSDEVLISIRAFKSIPFEIANDVSVTIRYTLYME